MPSIENPLQILWIVAPLLVASILVILVFEPKKFGDHVARTLVAIAVAIGTVFVALSLFNAQNEDRERRDLKQQRLIVESFLRSKILEVQSIILSKRRGYGLTDTLLANQLFVQCSDDDCEIDRNSVSAAAQHLRKYVLDGVSPDYLLPEGRAEIWQLMRSTPSISEQYFDSLTSILDESDIPGSSLRFRLNEKAAARDDPRSDKTLGELFPTIAALQLRQIASLTQAVCKLAHLARNVRTGELTQYDDKSDACAPYRKTFADFLAMKNDARTRQLTPGKTIRTPQP